MKFDFCCFARYSILIPVAIIMVFSSCRYFHKGKADIVASVYDDVLTRSDITGLVPHGTSKKDSINTVRNYIDNWAKQKLILHKAEQNLSGKQKDFSRQIEDYRNSLTVFTFENELIRQKLDTAVSEKEIDNYYNNNPSEFELKDNIIKVIYVKTLLNESAAKKIKQLYKSDRESDKQQLADLCAKHAVNFFLDDDKWLFFNDMIKEIPIETYDQESYLRNHRFIEFQDNNFLYFVNIKGFRIKEGIAPLNLERENVRNIIINKRKIKLIKDMEDEVYKTAIRKGDYKRIEN